MKIFITGVSGGIGEELARQLVGAGHIVWGVARREELLKKIQSELGADKFLFTKCDVGNENDVENTVKLMKSANFLPDEVVLNAAIFFHNPDILYQHSLFKQGMITNVFGSLIWVDKFLPDFLKRGSGSFIAISSISAYLPHLRGFSYSASKAALSMAFRNLRLDYYGTNINFSVINFGPIATGLSLQWADSSGKPKNFLVLAPEEAAASIKAIIEAKNKKTIYWGGPLPVSLLWRLASFLPDNLFFLLSKNLKH